jgi:hypothetical protein
MVRHSVPETYENDTEFDLTYMVLVFVTFLPTLILPWFYAHWILIGKVLIREKLMIYCIEDQAFLRLYDSAPRFSPHPPIVRKLSLFLSLPVCRRSA